MSSMTRNCTIEMLNALHTELWTSWASLLRSYAAAHGLNARTTPSSKSAPTRSLSASAPAGSASRQHHAAKRAAAASLRANENGTVTIDDSADRRDGLRRRDGLHAKMLP